MSYSKVLRKLIAESGYTYSEIAEKCNEYGRKIDKAYLSRVVNGKVPAPSEDLSRILAKIFSTDERKLVLEGYLEKAPEEIINAFLEIKLTFYMVITNFFENEFNEEMFEEFVEKIKEEPLSDFIISLINGMNNLDNQMELLNTNNNVLNYKIEEPLALPVQDNAMCPKILEGSKIVLKIQNNYEDGDILAIKLKNEEEIIVRFAFINEESIKLMPLNKQYNTITYNLNDVSILGKVTKVITNI